MAKPHLTFDNPRVVAVVLDALQQAVDTFDECDSFDTPERAEQVNALVWGLLSRATGTTVDQRLGTPLEDVALPTTEVLYQALDLLAEGLEDES